MSLINQMLQELDARRSEVSDTRAYGEQIRAVPVNKGVHAAWWLAGALGTALTGVVAWGVADWQKRQPHVPRMPASITTVAEQPKHAEVRSLHPMPPKLSTDLEVARESKAIGGTDQQYSPVLVSPVLVPADQSLALSVSKPAGSAQSATNRIDAPASGPPLEVLPSTRAAERLPPLPPAGLAERDSKLVVPQAAGEARNTPAASAERVQRQKADSGAAPAQAEKQVRELTPQQRAENEYRRAATLIQQGKVAESFAPLELALELDGRHAAARQTLIGILLEAGRSDEALRIARDGIAREPAQPNLAIIAARLQVEKGELRSAIETLERTLPHAADRSDYHAFLAALLQRDLRHKEATAQYLAALRNAPQNGVWWMGLGISLQADNHAADAREAFNRARATNALSPELSEFVEARLKQLAR